VSASKPEIEALAEPISFGLQDRHIGFLDVFPGYRLRHPGDVPLGGRQRSLFECEQLGVDVDPVGGFLRVRRCRILPFQEPMLIGSFLPSLL
jgi:hypothetical protein